MLVHDRRTDISAPVPPVEVGQDVEGLPHVVSELVRIVAPGTFHRIALSVVVWVQRARAVRPRRERPGGATGTRAPHRQPRAGSEPARKASAGLPGNPVGLPETFAGLQAALRHPRAAIFVLLQICGPSALSSSAAMCLFGGRRLGAIAGASAATVAVRPPGSRAIRTLLPGAGRCHVKDGCASTSRRRQRRPTLGMRRGCGDKLHRNSPRAW